MPDLTVGVDGRRARTGANVVIRSLADIRAAASRTGRSVGNLDRRMKAASTTAAVFRRALAGLGAGLALREFVRLGDSFVNVTNRLKIATDTTEELVAVQERLFQISQSTRSNYESNATLFNRLALSSKDLGISLEEVLNVTESLNQAVILSGAATTEASAGLIQLSQGLASNRLSGDELRSILEQLPVVAETIAKSLGITRGELKFFGEQGKLSADVVFKAFREAREELEARFLETVPTVAQSFVILRNAAIRFVGQLNESTGVITNLSKLIIFLANNFDTLVKGITVAAAALGPLVFGRSIAFASRALLGLSTLILTNPIGLLVSGLAAATAAAIAFGDEPLGDVLEESEGGFTRAALEAIGLADAIRDGVIPAQTTFGDIAKGVLQTLIDNVKIAADFFKEGFTKAFNAVTGFLGVSGKGWTDYFSLVKTVINRSIGLVVGFGKAFVVVLTKAFNFVAPFFTKVFDAAKAVVIGVVDFGRRALEFIGGLASKIFGTVRQNAENTAAYLGIDIGSVAAPIIDDAIALGEEVQAAFLDGFNTDYVGAIGDFLTPAIGQVIENTGEITRKRLQDQADKLAPGADLSKEREGKVLVPPQVQRELAKLVEKTRTPLEKQEATLKRIAELRPYARTEEELRALDRAVEESRITRLDEEFDLLGLDNFADVLMEAKSPLEQYNEALSKLNDLLAEGTLNQEEFDAAVKNAKDKILGLKDITEQFAKAAAENIQSAFADFLFDPFSDGLDGMVKNFADTMRRIVSEILAQQILLSFLNSLNQSNPYVAAATAAISGRAGGGPVGAGQTYMVGEKGPELFTPMTNGNIVPNNQMAAAPQVTVGGPTIVNTLDDRQIVAAFNRGGGGDVILNEMSEKRSAYRQALGIS